MTTYSPDEEYELVRRAVHWTARDKTEAVMIAVAERVRPSVLTNIELVHGPEAASAIAKRPSLNAQVSTIDDAKEVIKMEIMSGTNAYELMTLAALEGPALGARILTGIESGTAVGPRDPRVLSSEPGRFMIADTDTWDYLDSDPKAKLDSTSSYPDYILDVSDDVEALLDVQRNAAPCPDDEIAF